MDNQGLIICCTNDMTVGLTPHTIGGYFGTLLRRFNHPLRSNVRIVGRSRGINLSMFGIDLSKVYLIVVDDIHLPMGRVKVVPSWNYRRGHNALMMLGQTLKVSDCHVMLIGAGVLSHEEVNQPYSQADCVRLQSLLVGVVRAMHWLPNVSMMIQLSGAFRRTYCNASGWEG